MDKLVSIVIPTRNEESNIENCLKAVFEQSYKNFEVIVADAYSKDKTVWLAQKYNVKIVYNKYLIRAGACNAGIEVAKGEYIAFTDADCIPYKDWLEKLVDNMNDNVLSLAGATKYSIGNGIWIKSINLALGTLIGSGNSIQYRGYDSKHEINSPSGCNCMYRKQDLIDVGMFDTSISGGEDDNLNSRLKDKGKSYYIPEAIVFHNHKMQGLKQYIKRMFKYGKWKIENKATNIRGISPALFAPLFIIFVPFYIVIVAGFSSSITIKQKSIVYLFTLPIVYFTGHASFSIGLWLEIIKRIVKHK